MSHRALQDIADFIFMEDEPEASDIILIPGISRAEISEKAAELYKAGYAPYIMPSGKYSIRLGRFRMENVKEPRYKGDYETEFEFMKKVLMLNAVPESAILKEDQATHTMENAMCSAQALEGLGIDVRSAIIVCQAHHARRAYMSYASHFPGVSLRVVPIVTRGIAKESWVETDFGVKTVMGELRKCGTYFEGMRTDLMGVDLSDEARGEGHGLDLK